jgi:hypothetical protein
VIEDPGPRQAAKGTVAKRQVAERKNLESEVTNPPTLTMAKARSTLLGSPEKAPGNIRIAHYAATSHVKATLPE